jgi:hypothetical protein
MSSPGAAHALVAMAVFGEGALNPAPRSSVWGRGSGRLLLPGCWCLGDELWGSGEEGWEEAAKGC